MYVQNIDSGESTVAHNDAYQVHNIYALLEIKALVLMRTRVWTDIKCECEQSHRAGQHRNKPFGHTDYVGILN